MIPSTAVNERRIPIAAGTSRRSNRKSQSKVEKNATSSIMDEDLSGQWIRVTQEMCDGGGPLKGKMLYFGFAEFHSRRTHYPPAPEAEVLVFDRNDKRNLYESFSFGCRKTYPKLRLVFMFSRCDTQESFLRPNVKLYVPSRFWHLWKANPQVKILSESLCFSVLRNIEGRLTWQTNIHLVHTQLRETRRQARGPS